MSDHKKYLVPISGIALFSMFFGAGNLIFPPYLGQLAGDAVLPAILGFLLTGVGIVMLGVTATTKAGGSIDLLARHLGKGAATLFGILTLLAIGPGLATPRTAATTFELIDGALLPGFPYWVGAIIFFGLALFFSINPYKVVDWLGKILTPALLILFAIILIKGIATPLGDPAPTQMEAPFTESFLEGYQTMDVLAALSFTTVILLDFREKGVEKQEDQVKLTIRAGLIASVALSLIYAGLIYIGSRTPSAGLEELTRVELLDHIAMELLGPAGRIIMVIVMALACLTTAIGLTSAVGDFFHRITKERISRTTVMIISTLFSAYFSVRGVDPILKISVPILTALYPVAITLIILNLAKAFDHKGLHIGATIGALVPAVLMIADVSGHPFTGLENWISGFPDAVQPFYWFVPVIVLGLLGLLIGHIKKQKATS